MTRDKDSFQALINVVDMIKYYSKQGKDLIDVLNEIYEEHGHMTMDQTTERYEGPNGMEQMLSIIDEVRTSQPKEFDGREVKEIIDFKNGYDGLPSQNFLKILFEDNS